MLRAGAHPSNLVTYVGAALAVGAMVLALRGEVLLALALMTLVGLADLADGAWARRFTRDSYERRFGAALDSLADMVGFVALPIVLTMAAGIWWWLAVPVAVAYAWAGLTRLAAFDADAQAGQDGPGPGPADSQPADTAPGSGGRRIGVPGDFGVGDGGRGDGGRGADDWGESGRGEGGCGNPVREADDRRALESADSRRGNRASWSSERGAVERVPVESGSRPDAPIRRYRGLPVTFAGLILPLAGLVGALAPGSIGLWCCGALVMLAAGFVSELPVPKPTPRTYPWFGLLAVALIVALVMVRG
jgi:phosphatidylserine synthase